MCEKRFLVRQKTVENEPEALDFSRPRALLTLLSLNHVLRFAMPSNQRQKRHLSPGLHERLRYR
jgi:hypothetical protein